MVHLVDISFPFRLSSPLVVHQRTDSGKTAVVNHWLRIRRIRAHLLVATFRKVMYLVVTASKNNSDLLKPV